jgi:hypothetical protein
MAHTYEGGIPARVYLGTLLVALCFHPISVGGGKVTVWQTALHSDQLFSLSILVTISSLTTVHQQHQFYFLFYLHFLSYRRVGKRYNSVLEEYHVQTIYWATQSMLDILGWFGLEAHCPQHSVGWGNSGGTRCMWVALFKPRGTRLSIGIAALSPQFTFPHPISVCLWCFAGRAWDVCFCVAFVSHNRWGCYFRDWRKCSFLNWRIWPGKHQLNDTLFQAIIPSSCMAAFSSCVSCARLVYWYTCISMFNLGDSTHQLLKITVLD